MAIQVRSATASDLGAIVEINDSVQGLHARQHPDLFKHPADRAELTAFFGACLGRDDEILLVAEERERVVAYAWAAVRVSGESAFKLERRVMYLNQIAVLPQARRRGVGAHLVQAIESEARSRGLGTVALDSWQFNAEAHAFFAGLGYVPYRVDFWKHLDRPHAADP